MKIKKNYVIGIVLAVIILVIAGIIFFGFNEKNNIPIKNESNETPINETKTNETLAPLNNSIGNFKLTIKASNPQYKTGKDILIFYTIENADDKNIAISKDNSNGIEVKNVLGKGLEYIGSGENFTFIKEPYTLIPNQKITSNFSVNGSDYNFLSQGNPSDGYYNSITAYIGDVKSNKIMIRIMK